jgi:hypothetical protein
VVEAYEPVGIIGPTETDGEIHEDKILADTLGFAKIASRAAGAERF